MLSPWTMRKLLSIDPLEEFDDSQNELIGTGVTWSDRTQHEAYVVSHTVQDGIERIAYEPFVPASAPTLLMIHGMWHDARCWGNWQSWFARRGYESVSFSLPGHGRSPEQRDTQTCTLSYYLRFLADEVERMNTRPILFGHSMGGALLQWYLKYVGVPKAAVFVASWTSHDILKDSLWRAMKIDPLGSFLAPFLGWRFQFRSDALVRKWFFSEGNLKAAAALRSTLGPESEIVLMQHRPEHWSPPTENKVPALWLCAGADAIIPVEASALAAETYNAEFNILEKAGHDLMLDHDWKRAVQKVDAWLTGCPSLTNLWS